MASDTLFEDFRPPVDGLSIRYDWLRKYVPIFDYQVRKIRRDIARERNNGNKVVYLSCPISSHAGGYSRTNVEINRYTADRIREKWGSKVWVLNPSEYQMQSYRGAERLSISASLASRELSENEQQILSDLLPDFQDKFKPTGGDYMRMWTKILAESFTDPEEINGSLQPYGAMIDIYYFLGKTDVDDFFSYQSGGSNLATNVELYLSKEIQSNSHYQNRFDSGDEAEQYKAAYRDFYTHKASAIYSRGCHDEWNIWVELNRLRLNEIDALERDYHPAVQKYGVGSQIPGHWNQQLISPSAGEQIISRGYAAPYDGPT